MADSSCVAVRSNSGNMAASYSATWTNWGSHSEIRSRATTPGATSQLFTAFPQPGGKRRETYALPAEERQPKVQTLDEVVRSRRKRGQSFDELGSLHGDEQVFAQGLDGWRGIAGGQFSEFHLQLLGIVARETLLEAALHGFDLRSRGVLGDQIGEHLRRHGVCAEIVGASQHPPQPPPRLASKS